MALTIAKDFALPLNYWISYTSTWYIRLRVRTRLQLYVNCLNLLLFLLSSWRSSSQLIGPSIDVFLAWRRRLRELDTQLARYQWEQLQSGSQNTVQGRDRVAVASCSQIQLSSSACNSVSLHRLRQQRHGALERYHQTFRIHYDRSKQRLYSTDFGPENSQHAFLIDRSWDSLHIFCQHT